MKLSLVPRREDTIEGAGEDLRAGRITCVGLVDRCLAAIEEWEPKVHAWAFIDREGALEEASELDAELASGIKPWPLHGIPIGVKDIIDVAGMPTSAGAGRWSKGPADVDAPAVAAIRKFGAIFLGKTITTPYAFLDPPPTRNPWDLRRTPGGSSSGSAAAVATGMCLGAIGSQTVGSLTRPATYCGVASWKLPHHYAELDGVVPLAGTLDTLGLMARTTADLQILDDAWNKFRRPSLWYDGTFSGLSLGRLRGFFDERSDPAMTAAMDRAVDAFRDAGIKVTDLPTPRGFERTLGAIRTIVAAEAACFHRRRFAEEPNDYPPKIAELIREGLAQHSVDYVSAARMKQEVWETLEALLDDGLHALITPAATGPAPAVETTGDASFSAPWNYLNLPALSLPIGLDPDGLPLGIQFLPVLYPDLGFGKPFMAANLCERILRSMLTGERG